MIITVTFVLILANCDYNAIRYLHYFVYYTNKYTDTDKYTYLYRNTNNGKFLMQVHNLQRIFLREDIITWN